MLLTIILLIQWMYDVSLNMTITVENGPVKLIFRSRRKAENDFVLGLELKPIKYDDTTIPMADERKTEV